MVTDEPEECSFLRLDDRCTSSRESLAGQG